MNNPNPFVPKGSLLEQQSQRRSRLKLAVFCVLTVSVAGLVVMLIQGCKREQPAADNNPPPPDLSSNALPVANANPPPPDTNVAVAQSNAVPVAPPVQVTPPPPPPPVAPAAGAEYVVVQGDTLAKIAKAQGVTLKDLQAANPGVDPKKLKIKQKLTIPAKTEAVSAAPGATATAGSPDTGGKEYVVKSGDTLSKIAKKNGVTLKALRAANPKIATTDHIKVGDKLVIPAKTETAAPAPTPDTSVVPPASASAPVLPAPAPGH
jgi:LysM repeat protein